MSLRSSLAAQFGVGEEATWATAVTPTRFYEIRDLDVAYEIERVESEAIRASTRIARSDDWIAGTKKVSGSFGVDLMTKNMALLFKHAMGNVVTTGTGPYVHTLTPGTLTGKGLTMQGGYPSTDGVVNAFTWNGGKISEWTLACSAGELATLDLNVLAKEQTAATALATASYTSANALFSFTHGAITIGGATALIRECELKGNNGMDGERWFVGQDTTSEPLEKELRVYDGTLTADFESMTALNRYINGTEAALVLTFTRGADIVKVTANIRVDGENPTVSPGEILELSQPFKCLGSTTDASAVTVEITSAEAAP